MISNSLPFYGNNSIINQAYSEYIALVDISRSALCCHSNETRAPIANPPNNARRGTPTILASYIWVRAVVWELGMPQRTDKQTDVRDQYTFRLGYMPYAKCN